MFSNTAASTTGSSSGSFATVAYARGFETGISSTGVVVATGSTTISSSRAVVSTLFSKIAVSTTGAASGSFDTVA